MTGPCFIFMMSLEVAVRASRGKTHLRSPQDAAALLYDILTGLDNLKTPTGQSPIPVHVNKALDIPESQRHSEPLQSRLDI